MSRTIEDSLSSIQHLKERLKQKTPTGQHALLLLILLTGGHPGSSSIGTSCVRIMDGPRGQDSHLLRTGKLMLSCSLDICPSQDQTHLLPHMIQPPQMSSYYMLCPASQSYDGQEEHREVVLNHPNTVPHAMVPLNIKVFQCHFIAIICYCYEL